MVEATGAGPDGFAWLKHEVDAALSRATAALDACRQAPGGEAEAARFAAARAELREAYGALRMVELDGAAAVVHELATLLADLESEPALRNEATLSLACRVLQDVCAYLDGLAGGKPDRPMRLLPVYGELRAARGAQADPVELYFPRLAPGALLAQAAGPQQAARPLREHRLRYMKGLLAWLQGERSGALEMRAAAQAIASAHAPASQAAFWWTALAFFDALAHEALAPGEARSQEANRACARLEREIRALGEGSGTVPERLMRELLFFVARSPASGERLHAVREGFALDASLAMLACDAPCRDADTALASVRKAWDRFAAGDGESLAPFRRAADVLAERADALGHAAFAALARRVAEVGAWLGEDVSRLSEALVLEQSTALALAASALAQFDILDAEFDHHARLVCERLEQAVEGRLLRTAIGVPELERMSRRVQEQRIQRQTLAGMRAPLARVERELERFFADPGGSDIAALGEPLEQLDRALELLGEAREREALRACTDEIRLFSASDFVAREPQFAAACERIAETLCALQNRVDALACGAAQFAPPSSGDEPGPGPARQEPAGESPALVQLGAQSVPAAQYTLFSGEARMQLGRLGEERETLLAHGIITDALLSTVRVLAELAQTVELAALGELALALEQALSALALGPLSSEEQALIEEAIGAIERMVDSALELEQPASETEIAARLRERVSADATAAVVVPALVPEDEAALDRTGPADR